MRAETVAYAFLFSGALALGTSILYSLYILAFVGLGLTFWGALLLFVKPTKYVKASLLDSTAISSLKAIEQMVTYLNYKGKAVYLPPGYLKSPKGGMVFIPSKENLGIPQAKEVAEGEVSPENREGIFITPLGLDLANLYENQMRRDFTKVDLNYLQKNLPRLFIEDLQIAENLEISTDDHMIKVKATETIYNDLCKEVNKLSEVCHSLGCPLVSSIAVALTRVTKKPVVIEKNSISEDGKAIEIQYRIVEE